MKRAKPVVKAVVIEKHPREFTCPKGFDPCIIAFQRRWHRVYLLTVRLDLHGERALWRYTVSRACLFVASGDGFPTAEAASSAAMIRARIDHTERPA